MSNSSIWPIDKTLSGPTTPGQGGAGSNNNERVLCFSQSSSITGASPSDYLMSYPGRWDFEIQTDPQIPTRLGIYQQEHKLSFSEFCRPSQKQSENKRKRKDEKVFGSFILAVDPK